MRKTAAVSGIIGLLAGILLTSLFVIYAVNNDNRDMMGLNVNRMTSGNIDRNFIEQMIPHHESAIAMAKLAKEKAKHEDIKRLSDSIIVNQSAENDLMRKYYKEWFGADVPSAKADDMHGGNMMNRQGGAETLTSATDFDEAFLAEMIDHHQMGVMMANMLDTGTNRPEMKKLADDIITAQTKEINDMRSWQQQWGYRSGMINMMVR